VKEADLGKCHLKIEALDQEKNQIQKEFEALKVELANKIKESQDLDSKVKQLEVAVSDALKVREEVKALKEENGKVRVENETLTTKFKEEQKKRKDLHN
jgi:outer membrane murein-binding lipoprotein Lpp